MTEEPMVEPEAEPLTDKELDLLRRWHGCEEGDEKCSELIATIDRLTERVEKAGWLAEQDSCTIDRLRRERDEALALVRAKQSWIDGMKVDYDALNDEANTWRQRAEEAEECIVWVKCDDPEHERLAAAERTVREQREALDEAQALIRGWRAWPHNEWLDACGRRHLGRLADSLAALAPVADKREGGE